MAEFIYAVNCSAEVLRCGLKVSVMLTLSASAAENIGGVIAAIADLLRIAVPPSYEISRSPSPPMSATDLCRFGFPPSAKRMLTCRS